MEVLSVPEYLYQEVSSHKNEYFYCFFSHEKGMRTTYIIRFFDYEEIYSNLKPF